MGEILLGAIALVAIIFLLRGYTGADPKALVKALRYAGALGLAMLALFLVFTDRIGAAVFIASAAWGLFTRGHIWPGGWPNYQFTGRTHSSSGQSTAVRTAWLEMELDHDSGEMHGTVLQGIHAGRRLEQIDRDALLEIVREVDDPESSRLLEAYLDRTYGGDWRKAGREEQQPTAPSATGMSRKEALKVLGLEEGADEEAVRAAHRRLMLQNHPDRGGTDYIAAKINEAKDVLLGT